MIKLKVLGGKHGPVFENHTSEPATVTIKSPHTFRMWAQNRTNPVEDSKQNFPQTRPNSLIVYPGQDLYAYAVSAPEDKLPLSVEVEVDFEATAATVRLILGDVP